ncbi:hypothetical protein RSOLAG1IB_08265 [Rhizoctonia solani AG-1 IB]|uniref:Uncharacterized protein n=1 Tax=Thanatephorus cucumeris (strain AG1-IB / isolate 7/3/14) TaxID=1108050 RepID=A0A0B7FLF9_THACB|nr:hypothetical protein RSOLAG1IB_08265 [Rhizoctonia solani AG-1 IB]
MIMFTQPSLALPTASTKNEARTNQSDISVNKLSIADSLVLLQSLKQSRSKWLSKAFLRFSTSSKEKADQVHPAPPPHSLSLAGNCDLEIGPHLFPQTKIFFVQYRYRQPAAAAPAASSTPAVPPTPAATQRPPPITVSHELHAKVLAAAAKDPTLHHILQLASQGLANVTQLRTLGTAIKAIEAGTYTGSVSAVSVPNSLPSPAATAGPAQPALGQPQTTPATQPRPIAAPATSVPPAAKPNSVPTPIPTPIAPPKTTGSLPPNSAPPVTTTPTPLPTSSAHVQNPPARAMAPPALPTTAVLLEFAERPIDRWLLPTEYVLIDRRPNGDVHLSTFYPFDAYVPAGGTVRSKPAHPITMRFVGASSEIWDALSRTCTVVAPDGIQVVLSEVIMNVPQRSYLQYRIAPGALWEDIKTANPHAQSYLLPSKAPIPSATTSRQRRTDSAAGGSAPKKRKIDPGDGTAKPRAKGKDKVEPTPLATPAPAPTGQPTIPIQQPIVPGSNVPVTPASQTPASIVPVAVGSVATALTPTPTTPLPPPAVSASNPGGSTANSDNPAGPFHPPQHSVVPQASLLSQSQALPQSQEAGQPLDQSPSADLPVSEGKP